MSILAVIGGRAVVRDEVLAWEARRIDAVARKLDLTVPSGGLPERRAALLQAKLDLGPQLIAVRQARDVRWAARIGRASNHPKGRRRFSICELHVSSGSAAQFAAWFQARTRENDEEAMLAACPDHFVLRTDPDGRQEVLETTGGSPLASRFFVDYDDVSTLITKPDPAFPEQIAGAAFMADGVPSAACVTSSATTMTASTPASLSSFPRSPTRTCSRSIVGTWPASSPTGSKPQRTARST